MYFGGIWAKIIEILIMIQNKHTEKRTDKWLLRYLKYWIMLLIFSRTLTNKTFLLNFWYYYPILAQYSISIPPENVRKQNVFKGIDLERWTINK